MKAPDCVTLPIYFSPTEHALDRDLFLYTLQLCTRQLNEEDITGALGGKLDRDLYLETVLAIQQLERCASTVCVRLRGHITYWTIHKDTIIPVGTKNIRVDDGRQFDGYISINDEPLGPGEYPVGDVPVTDGKVTKDRKFVTPFLISVSKFPPSDVYICQLF
ncbi:unnamed protein product [Dibothriocephalus latus]|uniref:Uncharacterized protein n=1 Tax=Dibothriocephalus latus TaxID=60516 RepID=A0A3P6PWD2_DIBLA|nr:unnamed protein product [Dibothriocephalus latus]